MYPWTPVAEPGRNPARIVVAAVALPIYIAGDYDVTLTFSDGTKHIPWYWRDLELKRAGSCGSVRLKGSPAVMARPWAGAALIACAYWYGRDHFFGARP